MVGPRGPRSHVGPNDADAANLVRGVLTKLGGDQGPHLTSGK